MGTWYRLLSLFLAVVFGLTLIAPPAVLAKTKKAIIEFDVITKDLEFLDEPDGIIRLMVELPEAAAKYEPQLRDTASPIFQKTRTQIHEVMNAAQEAIKKHPEQREKLIKNLNKSYKSYINHCKKEMQAAIGKEWNDIRKRNRDGTLSKIGNKLKSLFTFGKGLFKVGTSVASLVVTMGADATAYFKLVDGAINIGKGLYQLFKKETYASVGAMKAKISQMKKALQSLEKGKSEFTKDDVNNFRKELESVSKSYSNGLAQLEKKHAALNVQINKILDAAEKVEAKGGNPKVEESVKKITDAIGAAHEFGGLITQGKQLVEKSRKLITNADQTFKAMKKGTKGEALRKVINMDNVENAQKALELAKKAAEVGQTAVEQLMSALSSAA